MNNEQNKRLQAIEAEQSVIGAVIIEPRTLKDLAGLIEPADFSDRVHRGIWQAMQELDEAGSAVDPLTISTHLEDQALMPSLFDLGRNTPSARNARAYAQIVADCSMRRTAIATGAMIQELAQTEGTAGTVADKAAELVGKLSRATDGNLVTLKDMAAPIIQELTDRLEGKVSPMGLPTGIDDLDKLTMGHHPDQLIVVAARPAMGKTAFAIQLAAQAARQGKGVFFASLEMGSQQITKRFISHLGGLDAACLKFTREMNDMEYDQLQAGIQEMQTLPVVISDIPAQTAGSIRANARQAAVKAGTDIGLVIVDYLQLCKGDPKAGTREQEIAGISRQMKTLSKELKCPVVVLSQLNRGLEQRTDKRPMMSDLRESGAIEQDADNIYMLYRPEVYDTEGTKPELRGIAEIIVRKQRDGETGTVVCAAMMNKTRFGNLDHQHIDQYLNPPTKAKESHAGGLV